MVLNRDISNTMEAAWSKEIVAEAIGKYGVPEIFNSDRGSISTSLNNHRLIINVL